MGGVPAAHTWSEISNGGTAVISSGTAATRYLWIGRDSGESGHVVQTGGRYAAGDTTYIGYSGTGTYSLSGTSSSFGGAGQSQLGRTYVGFSGTGTFEHNGGNHDVALGLTLGETAGSRGTYKLQSGKIWQGSTTNGDLVIGNGGIGEFEQTGGTVGPLIGSLNLSLGARSGGVGSYKLAGGSAQYLNVTLGGSGWGMFEQTGGTHTSAILTLGGANARGIYRQLGGDHTPSTIVIGATGSYEYTGGTLSAGSIVNDGVFDFAHSNRTLSYSGTIDLTRGTFANAAVASLEGGVNSLLIARPDQSPVEMFGSFSTQGIVHHVGTTLYVPAGKTTTGTATLSDFVDVAGWLGNSFTLDGGVRVTGSGFARAASVTVNDDASGISGGQLESKRQTIGSLAPATFTQSGGTNTSDVLMVHSGSRYVLSGGTLGIQWGADVHGTLDFGGGTGTLKVHHGIANLARAQVVNSSAAHAVVEHTGLLILPTGFDTTTQLASVTQSGNGQVHIAGSPLTIASGKSVWGGGEIDDHVNLNGSIQHWQDRPLRLNGGLSISGGNASLGTSGVVTVEDHTSGMSAGSLTAAALYVGRAGTGTFAVTGGSFAVADVYLGDAAGSSGTFNHTGGNSFGSSDYFVGYSGSGTLNQSTSGLGGNVYLGYNAGAHGSYSVTGGTPSGNVFAGYSGAGTYTLDSAAAVIEFLTLQAGYNTGSEGDVHLNAGTFKGDVYVGVRGSARLDQNGAAIGTATNTGSLYVGAEAGSTGTHQLTLGNVSRYRIVVGDGGMGTFVQAGGTVSAGNQLTLGQDATGNGTYRMQRGPLASNAATIGSRGTGSFEQLTGTHTVTNALVLGQFSGSSGTYHMEAGNVTAATLSIGAGGAGTFQHVAGTVGVTGAVTIGATASTSSGRYEFSGGSLSTGDVAIGATGGFLNHGGDHGANYVTVAAGGTYRLGGGSLQVAQGAESSGTFDFAAAAPASFNYSGLVNIARGNVLGGAGTSVTGSSGSMIILPAGFDPATRFANFSTAGLVHHAGSTLAIGAGQSFTLQGNIDDVVDIGGTLAATTGKSLNLNKGVRISGSGVATLGTVNVDELTSGISGGQLTASSLRVGHMRAGTFVQSGGKVTAPVVVASLAGTTGSYELSAGELAASSVSVGVVGTGTFRQTGGTNTVTMLTLGPGGKYEWSGGALVVNGGLTNQGDFNFKGVAHTLALKGVANFGAGTLSNTQNATLTGSSTSLMIFAPGYDPTAHFSGFSSTGLVHTRGSTLVIPSGRTLVASATIDDPVDVFGTVSGSTIYGGGLIVRPGASVTATTTANYDSAVQVMGGTLATTGLTIGRTATASLTQTGGSVTTMGVATLGSTATGRGTYTMTGGSLSVGGSLNVGSAGEGEFLQTGGSVTISGSPFGISPRLSIGGSSYNGSAAVNGTYRLEGGTLNVPSESIGAFGVGTTGGGGAMVQTGGTHVVGGELAIRKGRFELSGGTVSAGRFSMSSDLASLWFDVTPDLVATVPMTVTGLASVDGTFGFDIDPADFPAMDVGDSFVLVRSNGAIGGQFNNAASGSLISADGGAASFVIHYGPSSDFPANDLVLSVPAPPASTWSTDADGNWSSPGNWSPASPSGRGATAMFGAAITAERTVTIDGARNVARLVFDSPHRYTLAGPGPLTFQASVGTAAINVVRGSHTITSPITFTGETSITVTEAGAMLAISGNLSADASSITKTGAGTVELDRLRAHSLHVKRGTVSVLLGGGGEGISRVSALTIDASGRLDLNDNDLLVDYTGTSVESHVRNLVMAGRITSVESSTDTTLAVADNLELGRTSWRGHEIDASTIIGKYTYYGDSNLDGKVTGDDYVAIDSNLGTGDSWIEGDFNMDGRVSGDDYVAIDANLGKGTVDPLSYVDLKAEMVALHVDMFGEGYLVKLAAWEAAVPEPSASIAALSLACSLFRRQRGGRPR